MSGTESNHTVALPAGFRIHWYALESILGQGSFGITYLALDTNLNARVAVKEFLPSQLATRIADSTVRPLTNQHETVYEWGLERFIQEAQTLARFRHPNIVLVHSVFEANNTAYMVMEFRAGRSLADAFADGEWCTEEELRRILAPLLDGLARVHDAGFIHRDIKPSNIICDDSLKPTLLDFGSARQALSFETQTLTSLVSPGYAPFEQYTDTPGGEREGPWTDIYALGATIYTAIAGAPPVDAASRVSALVRGDPDPFVPAVQAGRDRYAPAFLSAIDHALCFHTEDRPQSVTEWREALRASGPEFETDRANTSTESGPGAGPLPGGWRARSERTRQAAAPATPGPAPAEDRAGDDELEEIDFDDGAVAEGSGTGLRDRIAGRGVSDTSVPEAGLARDEEEEEEENLDGLEDITFEDSPVEVESATVVSARPAASDHLTQDVRTWALWDPDGGIPGEARRRHGDAPDHPGPGAPGPDVTTQPAGRGRDRPPTGRPGTPVRSNDPFPAPPGGGSEHRPAPASRRQPSAPVRRRRWWAGAAIAAGVLLYAVPEWRDEPLWPGDAAHLTDAAAPEGPMSEVLAYRLPSSARGITPARELTPLQGRKPADPHTGARADLLATETDVAGNVAPGSVDPAPQSLPEPGTQLDEARVAALIEEARLEEIRRRHSIEADLLEMQRERLALSRRSVDEVSEQLRSEISQIAKLRARRQAELHRLEALQNQPDNPYAEEIARTEKALETLLTRYADEHPDVLHARRRLAELRERQSAP